MTVEEAIERLWRRWRSAPRRQDVEERAVSPQASRHVRLFVRAPELDQVRWPKKRGEEPTLIRGWHSGYVHELGDVDRILDGLQRRLDEAARKAARKAAA